jgi:hypothetical protein
MPNYLSIFHILAYIFHIFNIYAILHLNKNLIGKSHKSNYYYNRGTQRVMIDKKSNDWYRQDKIHSYINYILNWMNIIYMPKLNFHKTRKFGPLNNFLDYKLYNRLLSYKLNSLGGMMYIDLKNL